MSATNCKNCDKPLPGLAAFCPECGQSVKAISRPWLDALKEMLTELFDFDGRMLLSLRLLLTRPGFLTHEYINDRRISYTSPIRMYLVISLVFFFVLPMILPDTFRRQPTHTVSVDRYSKAMFLLLPLSCVVTENFLSADFLSVTPGVFGAPVQRDVYRFRGHTVHRNNGRPLYRSRHFAGRTAVLYPGLLRDCPACGLWRKPAEIALKFLVILPIFLIILGVVIDLPAILNPALNSSNMVVIRCPKLHSCSM